MRGKDAGCLVHHEKHRITPAYARKRAAASFHPGTIQDHPRVCGEKARTQRPTTLAQGSPPRMRGKVTCTGSHANALGITPAYAGKSWVYSCFVFGGWDHPRVCGEKRLRILPLRSAVGSPPRMRGKGSRLNRVRLACRITPAYAGKSTVQGRNAYHGQNHPRVCGEKCCLQGPYLRRLGSPPRVRGKVRLRLTYYTPSGITPACAGKR